jgi:exodeoxyribonuclease V gamma subunit
MPTHLFFSNNIETLAREFARAMAERRDGFTPPTIIVPNPYLQKWLQLLIAGCNGIAMNLDFRFLDEGLWGILNTVTAGEEKPSMIGQKEIQLMLYHSLESLDSNNKRTKPLTKYLFSTDGSKKADYDHKAWQLSSRLARYFIQYEIYREDMVQKWKTGKLLYNTDMEATQQHLYQLIFQEGGFRDVINKNWFTLPQYWDRISAGAPPRGYRALYLFGKSQLSPFHTRLIYELAKYLDIFLYQVNPCSEFWEDVTTTGEDRWQRIRSIKIDHGGEGDTLSSNDNENPLLKLWGKAGRETIKLLSLLEEAGSKELSFTSEWLFPEPEKEDAANTLRTVQDQVLRRTTLLESPRKMNQDTSIQIAACPEIFREVEAVYNSILFNLEHDAGLNMTDIAIMLPDMALYAPVIQSVFSRDPRRVSYSIIDSTAATDSMFGRGVRSILEIASGSFTRREIFDLIYNPCFLEAHGMDLDDAGAWLSWVDRLNIFRGFNKSDDIDPERNLFTWQQGLQRIRLGRIMQTPGPYSHDGSFLDYKNIVPYSDMSSDNRRTSGMFNLAIELLHARTKDLHNLKASGEEWGRILEGLISDFLAIPADRPAESYVRDALSESLMKLVAMDRLVKNKKRAWATLPFFKDYIMENLADIPSAHGSYLTSGINISALIPKRQIPFKIIYVMGMQEGLFPGAVDSSTLNLITIKRKIGDSTRPDDNRYLFLETLLAARKKFYITYISKDLQKDQDFFPNSVTGQLATYLNNHVISRDFDIIRVPPSGSSADYISPDSRIESYSDFIFSRTHDKIQPVTYSESDRLVLLKNAMERHPLGPAIAAEIKEKISDKIPDFSILPGAGPSGRETTAVSLRDVTYFLINPVESALRWHLSIYDDDEEDKTVTEDEPFFSAFPYNYQFITDVLKYFISIGSPKEIQPFINDCYRHARLRSAMPDGAYGEIDLEELTGVIMDRLTGEESLSKFLRVRNNSSFFQNIVCGSARLSAASDRSFPPLICPVNQKGNERSVELSGTLPFLWKNDSTGDCETLIITASAKPSVSHVIQPFLFYMASASGLVKDLHQLMGGGAFTVHVSHRSGITPYRYQTSSVESRAYLSLLLAGFLDETSFDLLPISIVTNGKLVQPCDMKEHPDDNEKRLYRQELAQLIDNDAEKLMPAYRPMKIVELMNAKVPADAYEKARDRLGMLLKPITGGGPSE